MSLSTIYLSANNVNPTCAMRVVPRIIPLDRVLPAPCGQRCYDTVDPLVRAEPRELQRADHDVVGDPRPAAHEPIEVAVALELFAQLAAGRINQAAHARQPGSTVAASGHLAGDRTKDATHMGQ